MMHFGPEGGGSPKIPRIFARLDRKGYRVICGKRDCGQDIAAVVLAWPGRGDCYRILCFPSGWYQRKDGVWVLSPRSKERLNHDNRIRSLGISVRDAGPLRKVPLSRRATGQGWESEDPIHALKRPMVPALAQCSSCGSIQTLDAPRLKSIDTRYPLPQCEVGGPVQWEDWELERIPEDINWDSAEEMQIVLPIPREFMEP